MDRFFLTAFREHKSLFLCIIITVAISKFSLIIPPLILGKIVDGFTHIPAMNASTQILLIGIFLTVGIFQSAIQPLQAILLTRFVQINIASNSVKWSKRILIKEFSMFESMRLGRLIKSVERGVEAYEKLLHYLIVTAFPLVVQFFVYCGLIIWVGGLPVFFIIIVGGVIYLALTHFIICWRRRHIDAVNACEDDMIGEFATVFKAAKAIKLENAAQQAISPLSKTFYAYANSAIRAGWSGAVLMSSQTLVVAFATGGVLAWGVFGVAGQNSAITAGELVVLFAVSGTLFTTIAQLGETYRFLDQFEADRKQFEIVLNSPQFDRSGKFTFTDQRPNELVIDAGLISSHDATPVVLKTALRFQSEEKVALIGPSGAGKTTFLEALAGLRVELRGRVKLNEKAIEDLSSDAQLELIRYLPQMPQFLEGNFDHAVLFGREADGALPILEALQLKIFTESRDDYFSENASNISGGEAKRLALLRILLRPGIFNLVDEPTASLDPDLLEDVWAIIFSRFEGRGAIIATHDLTAISKFDRVIIMRAGAIEYDGAPQDAPDLTAYL